MKILYYLDDLIVIIIIIHMNILILTHAFPRFKDDFSGCFVEELSIAYKNNGYNVSVFAPYSKDFNRKPGDIPVNFINYKYTLFKSWHRLGFSRGLGTNLISKIINCIMLIFLTFFGVFNLVKLSKKIKPDFYHAQWGIPFGFIGAVASFFTGVPLVISFLGSDVPLIRSNFFFRIIGKWICKKARVLTANSDELRDAMIKIGAPRNKFILVVYATDPDKFKPDAELRQSFRNKFSIDDNTFILLFVGIFVPKKGLEYLLKSLPFIIDENINFKLIVVGAGRLENNIKHLSDELNINDYVIFTGIVPYSDLFGYYNMADIFVMPTVKEPIDGLNVVVVEAMASGKPIIGTDISGNNLVIKENVNGILVPEKDPESLAEAIIKLLSDKELIDKYGKESRNLVVDYFSWKKSISNIITHFKKLKNKNTN